MERRVIISGIGVITPIGIGEKSFWQSMINGKSNVSDIQDSEISDLKVRKACVIDSFDFQQIVKSSKRDKLGRGAQLALGATTLALENSGVDFSIIDPKRIGASIGTTLGESQAIGEATRHAFFNRAEESDNSVVFRQCSPSNLVTIVAEEFGLEGPTMLIPTACAASNYAIGYAFDRIRSGCADIMIAGGTEPFSKILLIGFARMKSLAPEVCQPFDRNRKGLMVGEGAGILILEEFEHASRRDANIYGEILGYGISNDAHHMSAPEPEGRGAVKAIQRALWSAKLNPDDIQYINAHGTGTIANDVVETLAIKRVFGSKAKRIPMSSIKSMIGHSMGAAGAIEAVACALVLQNNIIPPTINYFEADPLCDLDYVPNNARDLSVNTIMSNTYGFFGHNASIVLASC